MKNLNKPLVGIMSTILLSTTFLAIQNEKIFAEEVPGGEVEKTIDNTVQVIGSFQPTTLDVSLPAVSNLIYNPDDETFTAEDINVQNNTNAPVYMKMKDINVSDTSVWKPALVAPNAHTEEGWRNLTKAQTASEIALGLVGFEGSAWLNGLENEEIWSTSAQSARKMGAIKAQTDITVKPIIQAGTSFPFDKILTTNYVFEFGLE